MKNKTIVVLALVPLLLSGCSSFGNALSDAFDDTDEKMLELAQQQAAETDSLVIPYNSPTKVDIESVADQQGNIPETTNEQAFWEAFNDGLAGDIDVNWKPEAEIQVENVRTVNDKYICLDIDVTNNIPPLVNYSSNRKKSGWWDELYNSLRATLPVTMSHTGLNILTLDQVGNAEAAQIQDAEPLNYASMVTLGIPDFTYDQSNVDTQRNMAPLLPTIEDGWDDNDAQSTEQAVDGFYKMPLGGTSHLTSCWSRTSWMDELLTEYGESADHANLTPEQTSGAYLFNFQVMVAGKYVNLVTPLAMQEGKAVND